MAGIVDAPPAPVPPASRESRDVRLLAFAMAVLWLVLALPLVFGERTFFLRDVFGLHLPRKAFGARELADGRIPAIDPDWALGQPFRGDPNVLAFYPDNLLYLALPFWSAFSLHYLLHWLLAFLALCALARELDMSAAACLLSATAYAGGGFGLSLLTFYNLVVVAAWWPVALLGVARGGRRGLGLASLAVGMALLGGEPVTAALAVAPLVLLAVQRHGWRAGLGLAGLSLAGGALVALPQIVATARVVAFTTRGLWGVEAAQVGRFALHPARLLELLLPLPFGWPVRYGVFDYWSLEISPLVPFVLSLHLGLAALLAATLAGRRRAAWAVLAGVGLLLAWAGGRLPGLLASLSGGLFRYPEKFLFYFALGMSLLAGFGCDRLLERGRRLRLLALTVAAVCAALAAALAVEFAPASARLAAWMTPRPLPGAPETQVALAIAALLVAALLAVGIAVAARRGRSSWLVALELVGLLQLAPLVATLATDPYRRPPSWMALLPTRPAVARPLLAGEPGRRFDRTLGAAGDRARLAFDELDPGPASLAGVRHPLAPDTAGIYSPFSALLEVHLRSLDWTGRVAWLRRLGVEAVVESTVRGEVPLPLLAERRAHGSVARLHRLDGGAPAAWWPRTVAVEPSAARVVERIAAEPDPTALSLAREPIRQSPDGRVRLVEETPDRLELEVEGGGGLVVVRRAFQPLYRARSSGLELVTMPVDLALLGVVVPPGRQRVVIDVAQWPELAAGGVALLSLLLAIRAVAGRGGGGGRRKASRGQRT